MQQNYPFHGARWCTMVHDGARWCTMVLIVMQNCFRMPDRAKNRRMCDTKPAPDFASTYASLSQRRRLREIFICKGIATTSPHTDVFQPYADALDGNQ